MPASQRGKVFRNSRYSGQTSKPKHGQYIDPNRFINAAVAPKEQEAFVPVHTFADFGFLPELAKNVADRGYEHPTPIQDGAILHAMEGRDIIGLANTGTGKTAAFVLPIIHQLRKENNGRRAVIIAPTRELAVQINDEFRAFAKGMGLFSALCLGGVNINSQIAQLKRNPQVVIGTPGRLKDLYNQRVLDLSKVGYLVLDEADRMLDMGFIKDIRFLIGQMPRVRQSLCFSATMPDEIKSLVSEMLTNPITVSVRTGETSEHVEQNIIRARSKEEKLQILSDLLRQPEFEKVLVFGQTKWNVQRLADSLTKQGISAEAIHGNKSQPQRQKALKAFKDGKAAVLVATDVAARGLDIPQVSHVINFDQPATYDDYVHRIGRTGRAGNRGQALTFVA
jgi:ATP-dependent RNA helicase RhlE